MRDNVLQQKQALVDEIKEKIENSKSIVFLNYRGLNVEEVTSLREKYRESNVEYKVYKNTMMRRAFDDLGYDGLDEILKGPSSIAFGIEDAVTAAKVSSEFAKDHEALEIKSGIVDGKLISVEEVDRLAKLPTKDVLIAQVLGTMNAPIQGLATVLNGTIRSLAIALNEISKQKEANA